MRRKLLLPGIALGALALAAALVFSPFGGADAASRRGPRTDYSLFCGPTACAPGGDVSVQCASKRPYEVNISLQNFDPVAVAVARVTFVGGDFVEYPIQPKTSFSLHQVAGADPTDRTIRVTESTATGNLTGWMSAATLFGGRPVTCSSTPA
jgi:hypothetical protein